MALADISDPNAIRRALAECDAMGEREFLQKYGFGPALRYYLVHQGRRYPSKAILGAAHGYQFPDIGALEAREFSGGEQTVRRKLNALGFEVEVLDPDRPAGRERRFAIAVTDHDWFNTLRSSPAVDTVNFWTPTPWGISGLQSGDRLYFLLKSPIRKLGGYGTFVRYSDLSIPDAWKAYGPGNGVDSLDALRAKVDMFAERRSEHFTPADERPIGCIELTDVILLDDDQFLTPEECGCPFPPQVVKLKYFEGHDGIAARLDGARTVRLKFELVEGAPSRRQTQQKDRKGQSAFRQQVLRHYGYRCCVTGEAVVELLEAAHIQPYIDDRSNHVQNGLCLRVDLHRLFDCGLLAVSPENTLEVSEKLAGSWYMTLRGARLSVPQHEWAQPSAEALAFHRASFR